MLSLSHPSIDSKSLNKLWLLRSRTWVSLESRWGKATWILSALEVMILWCIYTILGQNANSIFRKLQVCIKKSVSDYLMWYMSILRMIVQTVDVTCFFIAFVQLDYSNIILYSKTFEAKGGNLMGKKTKQTYQKLFLQLNFNCTDARSPSPL